MKKFTIKGVLDGIRGSVSQQQKIEADSIEETLRPDHFQVMKTVRHGFPYQPTAMAFDPVQKILAIGTKTVNKTCVSSSCPNLNNSNVCSGSSYNLNATISALSICMNGTVCGAKIDPRSITTVNFSLNQLLQGVPLTGVCYTTPDCVYTNSIPRFSVLSDTAVAMSLPNLTFVGAISCQLNQSAVSSLGLPLPPIVIPPATLGFQYNFNYSSTVVVNANQGDAISVAFNNPQLQVTGVSFNGLQFPSFPGIPDYLPTFKTLVAQVLGQMGLATFLGNFYKSLLQSALQIAQDYCNH